MFEGEEMYNKQYNEFCQILGKTITFLMSGGRQITDIKVKKISEELERGHEVIQQTIHLIYNGGTRYFELGFLRQDPFQMNDNNYKWCCDRMALSWSDEGKLECDSCGHVHNIVGDGEYSYRIVINEFMLQQEYKGFPVVTETNGLFPFKVEEQDTEEWTILTTKSFLLT